MIWPSTRLHRSQTRNKYRYKRSLQIYRKAEEEESIARPATGAEPCDLRSVAEMNWAASSKVGQRNE